MVVEKVTVAEKYTMSVNSSSLTDDARHHSLDVIAAVALSSDIGSALFRVKYAMDKKSLPELIQLWRGKVAKKAKERGWERHARIVADESLLYWLDDRCKVCEGRGAPKIIHSPVLEDCVCHACNGTAKRRLIVVPEIGDYVLDALEQLASMEREAGARAVKKLADQVRF
ncbi:MAG: hypothetical protein WC710_14590 [Gallionella sp.]|jgi:hypothetical protein